MGNLTIKEALLKTVRATKEYVDGQMLTTIISKTDTLITPEISTFAANNGILYIFENINGLLDYDRIFTPKITVNFTNSNNEAVEMNFNFGLKDDTNVLGPTVQVFSDDDEYYMTLYFDNFTNINDFNNQVTFSLRDWYDDSYTINNIEWKDYIELKDVFATKEYVDDAITNTTELTIVKGTEENPVIISDLSPGIMYKIEGHYKYTAAAELINPIRPSYINIFNVNATTCSYVEFNSTGSNPCGIYVISLSKNTRTNHSLVRESQVLTKSNTTEYTPTKEYHPVTKKYVDDNKFSGSYNDLTNKPNIPSIQGLASESYVNQQISKIQHPTYDDSAIKNQLANKADKSELFSGSYNDLTDKPSIPSIAGLATENFVTNKIAEAKLDAGGDVNLDGLATKDELALKADKTEVPSIEGLASESYVQQELAKISGGSSSGGGDNDDGVSQEEKEYVEDMMYSALGGLRFIKITQERYDALTNKDPNTMYIVVENEDSLGNSTGEQGTSDIYNLRWVEGSNLSDTGAVVTGESQAAYRLSDFVKVNPEYNYKVVTSSSSQFQVFYYDKNKNYIGKSTIRNDKTEFALYGYEGFIEFPEDVKYFRIRTNNKTSSVEISELGKRDDTFVAYQFRSGYTVASNGSVSAASGYMTSGDIKLEPDYDYNITFKGNKTRVVFFNTDGNKTGNCLPTDSTYYEGETTLTRADIPEAAVSFRMRFATGGEVNMNNINEHLQIVKTPRASKYLVDVLNWEPSQGFDENGEEIDDISAMRSGYMTITSGYDYMYTLKQGVPFGFQIFYYDSSKAFISCSEIQDDPCGNIRFEIPSNAAYYRLKVSQENSLTFDNVDSNVVIKKIPTVSGMLYQFGVLSDVHVDAGSDGNFYDTNHATNDYRKAVKFMEDEGAQFVAYGGDMATGDPGVSEQDYRKVLEILKDAYIPHYMISGNHDYGYFFKALIESRKYYVVEKENDMFIFVNAQSRGNTGGVDREIVDGVQSLIEQNPNKRIFLFFHYFIRNHGSGDGLQDVKYYTGDTLGDAYDQYPLSLEWANLIINSPNVIFCHGHSHFRFKCQEVYEFNNYYHADGECHSVHIPSCAVPRNMSADSTSVTNWPEGSEGYMVRVFADRVEFHAVQLSAYRYLTTYNFTINLPQGN